jgi:hypothetical protein
MTVDADRLVPLEFGQATAAAVPGARLAILKGMATTIRRSIGTSWWT